MATLNTGDCSSGTCPAPDGFLSASPSLSGNAFMLAAFGVLIPVNALTAFRYKTWSYTPAFIIGLGFEVMGYAGRILLRTDLANMRNFALFLSGTVIGPTFITGAIYLVLPHFMVLYGKDFSLASRPIYLNYFFIAFTIFALAFQTIGVAFAVGGTSSKEVSLGTSNYLGLKSVLETDCVARCNRVSTSSSWASVCRSAVWHFTWCSSAGSSSRSLASDNSSTLRILKSTSGLVSRHFSCVSEYFRLRDFLGPVPRY